jgi:tetratricopeptide (TPR) repeat protein
VRRARLIHGVAAILFLVILCGAKDASAQRQSNSLAVPAEAREGLRLLYAGDAEAAVGAFRKMQQERSEHPLGYLLEANAAWWRIYCEACEIKWNMIDAWKRGKRPEDEDFFRLTRQSITLAEQHMARKETAEMRLYAGMGHALEARLYALRDERRATARAGVKAREHLLRAIELDPHLADAFAGIGLYNYYVDTLSWAVKVLRFFMGIPGGDKKDGVRQLEVAMRDGVLTPVEARFYLAKGMRNNEQNYFRGVELLEPLVEQYPRNAVFRLLLGDMHRKLGHNEEAAQHFREAIRLANGNGACAARVRTVAHQALARLEKKQAD